MNEPPGGERGEEEGGGEGLRMRNGEGRSRSAPTHVSGTPFSSKPASSRQPKGSVGRPHTEVPSGPRNHSSRSPVSGFSPSSIVQPSGRGGPAGMEFTKEQTSGFAVERGSLPPASTQARHARFRARKNKPYGKRTADLQPAQTLRPQCLHVWLHRKKWNGAAQMLHTGFCIWCGGEGKHHTPPPPPTVTFRNPG